VHDHAPRDAPPHAGRAIGREIDAEGGSQHAEDGEEAVIRVRSRVLRRRGRPMEAQTDPGELGGDPLGRANEIGVAGADRAAGHAAVLRGALVLDKGEPAGGLDGREPERPV
jgi:hypothetical protein